MLRGRAAFLFVLAVSCTTRPATRDPVRDAAPPLEEGSSVESAVLVEAATESAGVAWENDWIYRHYGRFRKQSVALASMTSRRFDVITVELADHSRKVVYFDITNFVGK